MQCPTCGKSATMETRREHAADVIAGKATDPTQKLQLAAGEPISQIEVVEDHPHPNLKTPDGSPIMVKGNGDDVRVLCPHCGRFGPWMAASA